MLLLLRHPSWETMQAADSLAALPPSLVLAFGITNVTQGMLGYWVGIKLARAGQAHWTVLNALAGYFGMFFILVYGWDGLGFDRFFYDRDMLPGSPAWTAGAGATVSTLLPSAIQFIQSSVAITLCLDGVFLLPALFFGLTLAWRDGAQGALLVSPPHWASPAMLRLMLAYVLAVFVVALGSAIVCAVVVNYIGALLGVGDHVARSLGQIPANTSAHVWSYVIGLPLGMGLLWLTVLRPGGAAARLLEPLAASVQEVPLPAARPAPQ
jgi:hypothetical protein